MTVVAPPGSNYIQQPSSLWVPDRLGTYGDIAIDLAKKVGIPPDPTQCRDIDILMSYGPFGNWLTLETAHIEGRQNGKTKRVVFPIALTDFFLFDFEPDIMYWTAQLVDTALEAFKLLDTLIQGNEILSSKVKEITDSNNEHSVELMSGSIWQFMARSNKQGRGKGGKRLIYDEAMFLSATMMGATLPTLSARNNPQVMYASSSGLKESSQLRSLQKRGRRGDDPSLIYIEYKAPGSWDNPGCLLGTKCSHLFQQVKGCAMDDSRNWVQANHSMAYGRIARQFVQAERRALCETPEGVIEFGRERMGWEELEGGKVDPDGMQPSDWSATTDPVSEPMGEVIFSVDMNPEGSWVSIGVAGMRSDGNTHFGIIDRLRVGSDVPGRLTELTNKHKTLGPIVWQPTAPIKAYAEAFTRAGLDMYPLSAEQFSQGCGAFKEKLVSHTIFHRPAQILDDAFIVHERRVGVDGSWVIGRRVRTGDVSPMVCAVEAVLGVDVFAERNPNIYVF